MSFFMRADSPSPQAFSLFGAQHIVLLLILAGCITAGLYLITRLDPAKQRRILYAAAVLVPALELSHSVWMFLTGTNEIIKLLPLHLCGLQSLFIPLAVFTRLTCFRDFVYASSLLGGIFGTVFPAGVAGYYPVWSFQTLQTYALHGLLIFVPLALILSGQHRPDPRRFPRVLCIFLLAALVVGVVDRVFGENYMFLFAAPENTPLEWIYNAFGRGIYLASAFVLLASASFIIHLPFHAASVRDASPASSSAPVPPSAEGALPAFHFSRRKWHSHRF